MLHSSTTKLSRFFSLAQQAQHRSIILRSSPFKYALPTHKYSTTTRENKSSPVEPENGSNMAQEARDKGDPMIDHRDKDNVITSKSMSKKKDKENLSSSPIQSSTDQQSSSTATSDNNEEFKYDINKEFRSDAKDLIGKGKEQHADLGRMKKKGTSTQEPFLDVEAPGG